MADIHDLINQLGALGADPIGPVIHQAPVLTTTVQPSLLGQTPGAAPGISAPAILRSDRPLFDYSRLAETPDVPQRDIERYDPPRGVSKEALSAENPENLRRLSEIAQRGSQIGGLEWYNLEPLRQRFVEELGEKKGNQQFQLYIQLIAATSPRTRVPENVRNASYYLKALAQNDPLPKRWLDRSVPGRADWKMVKETQAPSPYGMMPIHVQNVESILREGGIPPLQNPKPASFVQNLIGNQQPVTIDTHNMRILGFNRDQPEPNEYGFLERMQQQEAAKLGMTPAQYQASLWLGGAEQTGVRSGYDPALKHIENRIELTAQKRGQTKEQVLKDFIGGRAPLLTIPDIIPEALNYLRGLVR